MRVETMPRFITLTFSEYKLSSHNGTPSKTFELNPSTILSMVEYQTEEGSHKATKIVLCCNLDRWKNVEVNETINIIKEKISNAYG